MDHGSEFESLRFKQWAEERGIFLNFIQPGKPAQNGYVERFNRPYREEVLDMNGFDHLGEVKTITHHWMTLYNHDRPHESLAGLSPVQFAAKRDCLFAGNVENPIFN